MQLIHQLVSQTQTSQLACTSYVTQITALGTYTLRVSLLHHKQHAHRISLDRCSITNSMRTTFLQTGAQSQIACTLHVSQTAIASVTYTQSAIDIADHSVAQCFTHSRDTALTLTALSQQIAHDTFTQHVLTITTIGLHNATARARTHAHLCTPLHIHLYIFMHIIAYTLIHIHAHQYINKHTDRQSCTPQYQQHCTHYSV